MQRLLSSLLYGSNSASKLRGEFLNLLMKVNQSVLEKIVEKLFEYMFHLNLLGLEFFKVEVTKMGVKMFLKMRM